MPTRTEIIEAGARALNAAGWTCAGGAHEPGYFDICKECRKVSAEVTEAALSAMLPLIKDQLAAEVRGVGSTQTISPLADTGAVALGLAEVRGLERGLNQAAQLIEEYEL